MNPLEQIRKYVDRAELEQAVRSLLTYADHTPYRLHASGISARYHLMQTAQVSQTESWKSLPVEQHHLDLSILNLAERIWQHKNDFQEQETTRLELTIEGEFVDFPW